MAFTAHDPFEDTESGQGVAEGRRGEALHRTRSVRGY